MLFLIAAIASTTLVVPPSLKPLLDEFAAHAEPVEVQQVQAALESSAPLAAQLRGLLDTHRLVAIRHPEAGQNPPGPFGAWQADGVIYLTTKFLYDQANSPHVFHTLDYSKNNPDNLVFSLGHLAYHVQNAAAIQACGEHAKPNSPKNDGPPHGSPVDLTASVQTVVHCMLNYEARADIQGWNDMIAAAVHDHRGEALEPREIGDLLMKFRYWYLFNASMRGTTKIVLPLSGIILDDDHNVTAIVEAIGKLSVADVQ
jgi:hypothetical protein